MPVGLVIAAVFMIRPSPIAFPPHDDTSCRMGQEDRATGWALDSRAKRARFGTISVRLVSLL